MLFLRTKLQLFAADSHISLRYYLRYRDDEDDIDGSGEEEHLYRENDGGGYNTHRLHEESINVVRMQFLGSFCVKNISPGLGRGD